MIELEIDGKKIEVKEGSMIIEAADKAGIYIPRFCYHKKLSIAANCRMCLIEVENVGKPLPACATPVASQMKVQTKSDKAVTAQRSVMEYLLINHPLDCPICDQGGECELQDLTMGYGSPFSRYDEGKRSVFNDNLGPLIDTEMTRCIQCTRCVRFGDEIAGQRELGVLDRGEKEKISTYIKHTMQSELSGNIIDLCPVGALTAKPSRFSVRGWELVEKPAVSPHDCVGSNVYFHTRSHEFNEYRMVMRAVPKENEAINETWASDRDRFSYAGLYHAERIYKPRIKKNNQWQEVEWSSALQEVATILKKTISEKGADQLAALISPNATVEEFYLLQKLWRALGSSNIDYRLRATDFSDQHTMKGAPNLGMPIASIENLATILLVGSDIRTEQPLLAHRIRKAALKKAQIMIINPMDYSFTFSSTEKMIHADVLYSLAEVAKALAENAGRVVPALAEITPSKSAKNIAQQLKANANAGIFVGAYVENHPNASQIKAILRLISELSNIPVGVLSEGANAAGAWLAGAIPHRGPAAQKIEKIGRNAKSLLTDQTASAYLLFNIEPEYDSAYPSAALSAFANAEVICVNTFVTPAMEQYADIILPLAPFTESAGTFVNCAGDWQSFEAVSAPMNEAHPGWQILCVLAQFLNIRDWNYHSVSTVRDELKRAVDQMHINDEPEIEVKKITAAAASSSIMRLAPWQMYRVDPLVRRSKPLQDTIPENMMCIFMHESLVKKLNFEEGDRVVVTQKETSITLPIRIDNRLAPDVVLIYAGFHPAATFDQAIDYVTLKKEHYG